MRKLFTALLVASVMIGGILGITNPGFRQPYKLFGNSEGKLVHNYFIFSVYEQDFGSTTADGTCCVYKRYLGIALNFFEIGPVRKPQ